MVAGQDRYYQIVRCFRDEDLRADRQFEFTQLDIEMSFVDEEDLIALMEPLMARLLKELRDADVATPFPRLTYEEMMERFGSDKPDLRYGMELVDLAEVFAGTGFNAFAGVLASGDASRRSAHPAAERCPARSSTSWSRTRRAGARRGSSGWWWRKRACARRWRSS